MQSAWESRSGNVEQIFSDNEQPSNGVQVNGLHSSKDEPPSHHKPPVHTILLLV